MSRQFIEVAVAPPVGRELTYGVPAELTDAVRPGSVVLVPVQRRLMTGFALSLTDPDSASIAPDRVRDIAQILDAESPLSADVVELCRWMADYYLAPLGSALAAALPPGVQMTSSRVVQLRPESGDPADRSAAETGELESRICEQLASGPLHLTTLKRRLQRNGHLARGGRSSNNGLERALQRLRRSCAIEIGPALRRRRITVRHEQRVRVVDRTRALEELPALERRAPRQALCLQILIDRGEMPKKSLVAEGFRYSVVKQLSLRGLVESFEAEVTRDPLAHIRSEEPEKEKSLTADQQRVIEPIKRAIDQRVFSPILLKGVTGSGKTLVYVHAVDRALEAGRGAIVLVPEIALAWQMVRRFRDRFGDRVAVLHSQLSPGERYDTWRRLRRGEQSLVIGARSCVLAPVRDLGIIVVDEEHDASYSQDESDNRHGLSYNARDLAVVRGRRAGAVVLLGSATPSLESYANAGSGKYGLQLLPRRIGDRPLPRVDVADMRKEPYQRRQRAIFSRILRLKMRERFERSEQVVLLQNRRGFAPVAQCGECGESLECSSCRVALTYHRSGREGMRCHYCDYESPAPEVCPGCASPTVRFEGVGTQRVEAALLEQFPGIRVIRMDVDTTGWKGAHDELVESFRRREADVLLGTQMVAKGLDFPGVTLVGVISADTGMHLPDFRATERSFQLLTQVAGRAGRGDEPGEVVIQTYVPSAPVLQAAAAQDYDTFAESELDDRQSAGFPPFQRLVLFRWRGAEESAVARAAGKGVEHLMQHTSEALRVLGPAPAPLARLRNQYRWQALLSAPSIQEVRRATKRSLGEVRKIAAEHGVELAAVVDPQTTM